MAWRRIHCSLSMKVAWQFQIGAKYLGEASDRRRKIKEFCAVEQNA